MAKITIDSYGTKYYLNDAGEFHREDGPAVISKNGIKRWYTNGIPSSHDHPCEFWIGGQCRWFVDQLITRINGPAYDSANGCKVWIKRDKIVWPKL